DRSELLFVVTPRLVKPLPPNYPMPTDSFGPPTPGEVFINGNMEGHPQLPSPVPVNAPANAPVNAPTPGMPPAPPVTTVPAQPAPPQAPASGNFVPTAALPPAVPASTAQ